MRRLRFFATGFTNRATEGNASGAAFFLSRSILAIPVVLAVVFAFHTIICTDIWWHLAGGRYILETRGVPHLDPLSFTAADREWIDLHWGFEVLVYGLYRLGGTDTFAYAEALIVAATFLVLLKLVVKGRNELIVAAWLTLVVFVAKERFFLRPHIVTYLFLVVYLLLLKRLQEGKPRGFWIIPLLHVLWVNMHALNVYGIGVLFAYLAGALVVRWTGWGAPEEERLDASRLRLLGIVGVCCLIATLLNPYGLKGALFPLKLLTRFEGAVKSVAFVATELRSPFAMGMPPRVTLPYMAMLLVVILSFALNRKRFRLCQALMVAPFMFLALKMARVGSEFALVASWVTVVNFTEWTARSSLFSRMRTRLAFRRAWIWAIIAAVLWAFCAVRVATIVTNEYYITRRSSKRFGPAVSRIGFSSGSPRFIRDNHLAPNMFNVFPVGGFLSFHLWPDYKTFIDGRLELFDTDYFGLYIRLIENTGDGTWEKVQNRFRIRFVVVQENDLYQLNFFKYLMKSPDWVLVYLDEVDAILVRRFPENEEIIARHAIDLTKWPGFQPAEVPDEPVLATYRGDVFFNLGILDRAKTYYEAAERKHPDFAPVLVQLGNVALAEREFDRALGYCDRVLRRDPGNGEANFVKGLALYIMNRRDEALRCLENAARKQVPNAVLYLLLGRMYHEKGQDDRALWELSKAVSLDPSLRDAAILKGRIESGRP